MAEIAARLYFALCRASGRLLRSARYSGARIVDRHGGREVRKRRRLHAPLLVWLGAPLMKLLHTGVRVLPQRAWEAQEHLVYRALGRLPILVDEGSVLVLPWLPGRTLADVLDDPALQEPVRRQAIERAAAALAAFHRLGFTHGDAMAENVLVDLDTGTAHWFDFETRHDPHRPIAWKRADDLRALLVTCLIRTPPARYADTLALILDAYADEDVARALAAAVASVWMRPLTFHLAQAALSLAGFREVGRLLRQHLRASGGMV